VSAKKTLSLYFHNNITYLSVGLLRICKAFSVCCKTVYWWVITNCCFVSYMRYWLLQAIIWSNLI